MNELTGFEQSMIYMTLVIAVIGLAYALYLRAQVLAKDKAHQRCRKCGLRLRLGPWLICAAKRGRLFRLLPC